VRARVLLAVAIGGAAGACLRHLLNLEVPDDAGEFPWTTFGINVVGCFLLALLPASAAVRRHALLPPLLGTGVLGGFTTLSTWSEQTRALYDGGHTGLAGLYLLGTFAVCLAAVAVADHLSTVVARREFDEEEGDL
jgi:CrcB protein